MKRNNYMQYIHPHFSEKSLCQADKSQELFINLRAFKDSCKLINEYSFDWLQQLISA